MNYYVDEKRGILRCLYTKEKISRNSQLCLLSEQPYVADLANRFVNVANKTVSNVDRWFFHRILDWICSRIPGGLPSAHGMDPRKHEWLSPVEIRPLIPRVSSLLAWGLPLFLLSFLLPGYWLIFSMGAALTCLALAVFEFDRVWRRMSPLRRHLSAGMRLLGAEWKGVVRESHSWVWYVDESANSSFACTGFSGQIALSKLLTDVDLERIERASSRQLPTTVSYFNVGYIAYYGKLANDPVDQMSHQSIRPLNFTFSYISAAAHGATPSERKIEATFPFEGAQNFRDWHPASITASLPLNGQYRQVELTLRCQCPPGSDLKIRKIQSMYFDIPIWWGRPIESPDPEIIAKVESLTTQQPVTRYHLRPDPFAPVPVLTQNYYLSFPDPVPNNAVFEGSLQVEFDGRVGDLHDVKIFDSYGRAVASDQIPSSSVAYVAFQISLQSSLQQELSTFPTTGSSQASSVATHVIVRGCFLDLEIVERIAICLEESGWIVTNITMDPAEGQEGALVREQSWKVYGTRLDEVSPVSFAVQLKGITQLDPDRNYAVQTAVKIDARVQSICLSTLSSDGRKVTEEWHAAVIDRIRVFLEGLAEVEQLSLEAGSESPRAHEVSKERG